VTTELFAEVALRAQLRGRPPVLTYRVPPLLRGLLDVGQLVWVPLRQRRVQGVVLALHSGPPDDTARDLLGLGDGEAQLTTAQLALARWLAAYYRVPLYDALAPMLPPGSGQEAETTWRASPLGMSSELGALPERERAVLYYLRTHGESGEKALRAALRGSDADLRDAYAALYGRALVLRGSATTTPKARPRVEHLARLRLDPAAVEPTLEALRRAPKQAAVVSFLAQQTTPPQQRAVRERGAKPDEVTAPEQAQPAVSVQAVYAATGAARATLRELERRGLLALETRETRRDPLARTPRTRDLPPPLTAQQETALAPVRAAIEAGQHAVFLLHGVTGSGKTELYLRSIGRALRLGKQALVLVPEIALTTQLVRRFAARFGPELAVLHSGLSLGERYDEWRRLRRGDARIAIGSRSAVFAPLPHLGLVIVDEEHEPSYKHEQAPRYHARDVALQLAKLCGATLMLGSATPSVESYAAAQRGDYQLIAMSERVGLALTANGLPRSQPLPLPQVQLVDMRKELRGGNRSIFSTALMEALDEALGRGEQSLLFLNRRGAASFVMCRDCGHVVSCPRCATPLTLHLDQAADDAGSTEAALNETSDAQRPTRNGLLVCHSCNHRELVPLHCPQCWSTRIRQFGIGTQRVAEEVALRLPGARVLRWDRDTVTGKDGYGRLLDQLLRREADVLVGTQMVAKGLDLPGVTVVGVVAADTGLRLPDFRASERTFQLLTQVAGRAGRRDTVGRVVIQSYTTEHYALQAAREHDYAAFYQQEIAFRRQLGYPPFARLVRFVVQGASDERCERAARALAERINEAAPRMLGSEWGLIGPAPCFQRQLRGRYRWHLLLRARQPAPLLDALGPLPGWSVDVDPQQVL
jgi:primosomal protein N' (replication factor Y) (superfamily II helicase)